ncbi:MAG: tol-pal system YbgF family protein [Nitrospinota bacterium]
MKPIYTIKNSKKKFWNTTFSTRLTKLILVLTLILQGISLEAKELKGRKDGFEKALYINPYYSYAVDLSWTDPNVLKAGLSQFEEFSKYLFYKIKSRKKGKEQYRLRFGFFIYKKSALRLIEKHSERLRNATVVKVSKTERKEAVISFLNSSREGRLAMEIPVVALSGEDIPQSLGLGEKKKLDPVLDEAGLGALLKEAKMAIKKGANEKAVTLLTQIIQYSKSSFSQPAQEYLGLARERMGQFAYAKAEYEKYLNLYKDGADADRVRQRLRALVTARELPRKKLLGSVQPDKKPGQWDRSINVNWAQYFNLRLYKTGEENYDTGQANLFTDMYLNSKLKNSAYDIRFLFSGGYENDFIEPDENELQIDSLSAEADLIDRRLSCRFGRQSSRGSNGISGRFDGLSLFFEKTNKVRFSGFTGYPVEYPISNHIKSENPFVSLAVDLGTYKERWDFSAYVLNQEIHGVTDRRAMGGEIHFVNSFSSIYSLMDYDVSFGTVNSLFFSGTWFNKKSASFHISFDFRKSPFISTSNALFNEQNFESISELLGIKTEAEIRRIAEENTGFIQSISAGGTYTLLPKLQFFGEVNLTKSNYSPSGYDIFSSAQLAWSDVLKNGSYTTLGSRYFNNSGSDTYTLRLRTRYPVLKGLKVIPRVQFDYKLKKRTEGKRYTTSSSLKTEYRWKRKYNFDFEVGGDWSVDTPSNEHDLKSTFFVLSGYRITL